MRVLFLAGDAYGGHGGIATYNRDVIRAMCEEPRITEVVVVPRKVPRDVGDLPAKVSFDMSGVGGTRAYLAAVARQARGGSFAFVYCALINLAPIAWLVAKILRVPWFLAIYGIDAWQRSDRPLVAWAAARADRVISISQVTLDRFLAHTPYSPDRTSLAPNAIHTDQFGMGPKSPELAARYGVSGSEVILTFGRMEATERYKGFDEVIEVLADLRRDRAGLKYIAAGDGTDRPRLEAKARECGVADAVVFTGFVPESEKVDLYRLADVYAMPSYGEGFGFVLVEALACGVPAIGSRTDGGREALRDGQLGAVIDPHDPAALKAAILAALDKPKAIPAGLAYFEFAHFAQRLIAALAQTVPALAKPFAA